MKILMIILTCLGALLAGLLALLILLSIVYLLLLIRPRKRKECDPALLRCYAHRGLHGDGVPENSLSAFALACEKGYGIELDVQLSHDGEVMVFHDYTLLRMTGEEGLLCERTAEELGALSLNGTEQTIPTFAKVLELVDGRVPLLVELKGESTDVSLCKKVAELLLHYEGAYCIESFNPLLLREMQKQLPKAFCGLLYTNVCRDKKKVTAVNGLLTLMAFNFLAKPQFVAYNQADRRSLPVKLTTKLYRAPKFVWTVRTEGEMSRAKEAGECPIFEYCEPYV